MANELGKRFRCDNCGTEVLCTKAGGGAVTCCDKEMELQKPKPLPSSD
ncbi:MAG: desulfoferrodoxin [Chloroflexi bacterium]|nr:desulfoferrodoxin [Chloroflexota bacterium]